jgi:hypothetical protein
VTEQRENPHQELEDSKQALDHQSEDRLRQPVFEVDVERIGEHLKRREMPDSYPEPRLQISPVPLPSFRTAHIHDNRQFDHLHSLHLPQQFITKECFVVDIHVGVDVEEADLLKCAVAYRVVADQLAPFGRVAKETEAADEEICSPAQKRNFNRVDGVHLVSSEGKVMQVPVILTQHEFHLFEVCFRNPVVRVNCCEHDCVGVDSFLLEYAIHLIEAVLQVGSLSRRLPWLQLMKNTLK